VDCTDAVREPLTDDRTIEELARSASRGDRDAFEPLMAVFRPRVEAFVRSRLGPRVLAHCGVEDVLQETFAKAFEHIERLTWRDEDAFFSWLAGIAQNVILRASRKTRRAPLRLEEDIEASDVSPSRGLRRDERLERLQRALDNLSPDHRQVIVLARIRKLQVAEIGRRMERSENAVKKLLARALDELKKYFGDTESLSLPDAGLCLGEDDS
jgi:RNA polymerase sigma-70 factor (ECF subfamily)